MDSLSYNQRRRISLSPPKRRPAMLINKDIGENDKIILNNLGKDGTISISQLMNRTNYRRKSSVYKRMAKLREEGYLYGPFFDINYNAIGENKLYRVFVFADYHVMHKDAVLEGMKKINCWTMIYPVRTTEAYLGIYRCNNWNYIASLFKLMKKWGWLKDYSVHKSEYKWIRTSPDFFGDFIPSQEYQPPRGPIPQYQYYEIEDKMELTKIDLVILKYLSRRTSRLTEVRDLEYQYFGLKWHYHDLKRSFEKLSKTGILMGKHYLIFPLPGEMCSLFYLICEGKDVKSTLRMMVHFGEGFRLTKAVIVAKNRLISYFTSHPLLEGKILGLLEDKVSYANLYGIKTYPSQEMLTQTFNESLFDEENQRWTFPYSDYREELKKVKEKKEKNGF
jgi:DNA-binding Lrp family transcriptional regulator